MKLLRLVALIVLAPIWLPLWLMMMGVGIMLGQPMVWPSIMMHANNRPRADWKDLPRPPTKGGSGG